MKVKDLQNRAERVKNLLDPNRVEREKKEARKEGIAKGLAFGALLGGITGIFFAPDKGENTRKKTKEELEKAKDQFEVNFAEGKEKLSEVVDTNKEVVLSKVQALKDRINYEDGPNVVEDEELEPLEEETEDFEQELEKVEA